MAGPWFMVEKSGNDWHRLDTIWISNGRSNDTAHVEIRVELEEAKHGLPEVRTISTP